MGKERIGYRRLYDAIACSLADKDEFHIIFPMDALLIEVYLGSKPKLGITVSRSDKYVVPGESSLMLTAEYKKDASESSYPRHFFTEILCSKQVEVSEDLSQAFLVRESSACGELLRMAEQDAKSLKTATDLIAGTIGLRFHRQFVIEVINENFFVMRGAADYAFQNAGPGLEILDGISLNPHGAEILRQLLEGVGQATSEAQEFGAASLTWLLKAWGERDNISKFMALFTLIEIVLARHGYDPSREKEKQEKATQIRDLLITHGGSEASNLLTFFDRIMGQQRPSLASRFEEMAKQAQIDGWETDVAAFKRFNSIRNKLLHRGEQHVQLVISVGQDIEEETRQLEDIAERYVSWALFRDGVVYQNRWRSLRNKRQGEKLEQ